MEKIIVMALILLSSNSFAGCTLDISKKEYGDKWPLTIDKAQIFCMPGRAVILINPYSGEIYALNGIARNKFEGLGIDNYLKTNKHSIVSDMPMSHDFIKRGLELCDDYQYLRE